MIQRIQGVSFTGMQSKVAGKAAKKLEEAYVSASSNLLGTVNAKKSERMLRDAKILIDKDTFAGRVASLTASKRNINDEIEKAAMSAREASAAAKAQDDAVNMSITEFNFFG